MGKSKIEWLNMPGYIPESWNITSGCNKVSSGCANCWAERIFPRIYNREQVPDYQNLNSKTGHRKRKFTDIKLHPEKLDRPLHWKKPRMCFVNSMSDLFHEKVPFKFINEVFQRMEAASDHIFIILTKRPKRMKEFFEWDRKLCYEICQEAGIPVTFLEPLKNVWLGISAEDQKTFDERTELLLQIPASKYVVSLEPMLEYINMEKWTEPCSYYCDHHVDEETLDFGGHYPEKSKLNWILVGAESGPKRRNLPNENILGVVNQAKEANIPVFVKQIHMNGQLIKDVNRFPKCLQFQEYPI